MRGGLMKAISLRNTILVGRNCRVPVLLMVACSLLIFFVAGAWGAIPASERAVLLNLYSSTNGASWTNKTGWNEGDGTECSWYGISCDTGPNHVIGISLNNNNLSGPLPAIGDLTYLQTLEAYGNNLTGPIPALSGLTSLQTIYLFANQLTGSIPSLSGLANLQTFYCSSNQLTGSIPSLDGLTSLNNVDLRNNQLTGSIPSINGLTSLSVFIVAGNKLTGSIPSLNGMALLMDLDVSDNQLTGSIPSLNGLINLTQFYSYNNQLTGSIPSFTGLTNLMVFEVSGNRLSGSIPSLSGLSNLAWFYVDRNQLTGSIPPLTGLSNLKGFYVQDNQLTGTIPSLSGLSALQYFWVNNNQLTGDIPAVPSPTNKLWPGNSFICLNYLNHTSSTDWDAATGTTPWYQNCPLTPVEYTVSYNGNGNTGGSLPSEPFAYLPGEMVTVEGNTGALYKTGYSFNGWNTDAAGFGMPYVGGDVFWMSTIDRTLYAQWTTANPFPVRIGAAGYADIKSAYDVADDGETIEAEDGLRGQNLTFDNPNGNSPFNVKVSGGYNADFTTQTGATLVSGRIEISSGTIEIERIIIE